MSENDFDLSEFDSARDNDDFDGEDGEWVDLADGESVTGELVRIQEDAGQYDSRVYEIDRGDDGPNALMWGNGSVDAQVDEAGVEPGDLVHIERDGTYTNKYGEFNQYNVMFKKAADA